MRTIIVGDIHGCLDEFKQLLNKVSFSLGEDDLVLLGDLMDRGPDPVGVVRFARLLGARNVMGNHDDKHVRFRKHEIKRGSRKNPINFNPYKTQQNAELSNKDFEYLASSPTFLRLAHNFIAVHAGFLPGTTPETMPLDQACRIRWVDANGKYAGMKKGSLDQPDGTKPWMDMFDGNFHVVYGHNVHSLDFPRLDKSLGGQEMWGLDTGCCFGGHLTALVLDSKNQATRDIYQVKALKTYKAWRKDARE